MKRWIALILSLLMVLSLTACGSKADQATEGAQPVTQAAEQTETAAPVAEETEQTEVITEPVVTEAPTEAAPQPAFDTAWASNEFEKLIPQPPFEGWEGEQTSDSVYEMVTSQANADGSGAYYATWAEYMQTLTDCGFVLDGNDYKAEGTDANGNGIELMCGDGHAWITIIKNQ